ncbi:MAG: universal stress protein, partial [Anaerolineales bacterium]
DRMVDRYTEHLFREILVPVSGSPGGWQALEQAIRIAARENADLHGLHVVLRKKDLDSPHVQEVQAQFNQRCQAAGVSGSLATERGEIAAQVVQRALLSDLVVLSVEHPPAGGLSSLGSGLRTIIWRTARPILTVPGMTSPMDNAILAYDGSLKSREALFIAAYLAERWQTRLTVVTASQGNLKPSVQDDAKKYLDLHEIQAEYIFEKGGLEIFPALITERQANLVLLGSYGGSVWQEVMLGSLVNLLLRQAACPLLICR